MARLYRIRNEYIRSLGTKGYVAGKITEKID